MLDVPIERERVLKAWELSTTRLEKTISEFAVLANTPEDRRESSSGERHSNHASNQPISDFGIVPEWIAGELRGNAIVEGVVNRDGAPWSPARVIMSDVGPELIRPTTAVSEQNMHDERLWANQP